MPEGTLRRAHVEIYGERGANESGAKIGNDGGIRVGGAMGKLKMTAGQVASGDAKRTKRELKHLKDLKKKTGRPYDKEKRRGSYLNLQRIFVKGKDLQKNKKRRGKSREVNSLAEMQMQRGRGKDL